MKTSLALVAASLLLATTSASAQSFVATPSGLALAGAGTAPAAANPHVLTRPLPGGGSITYFEAVSSQDERHAQFAQLRQAFEACLPTVVLYEGTAYGTDSTEAAAIRRLGAIGYVRFLAEQYDVPAASLDSKHAEYIYLRATTDPEQLKLYYLLQEIQRFQTRPDASKKLTTKAMKQFIANSYAFMPGTEHVIRNLAEFKAAYRKHCPAAGAWWKTPAACLTATANGAFGTAINRERAAFQAQHRASALAEQAQDGQRVLVVVVPGHLPA